jgi:Alpha-glucosidases, family 31 of glycosyl hydrolases
MLAGPAAEALAQRTVTRLGDFSLSMGLVSDEAWVFEISVEPPEAARPFDLSLMTRPDLQLSQPSGGGDNWSSGPLKVSLSHNPPTITVTRQDGDRVFSLQPYAPDGQLSGLNFSGEYSHLMGLGYDSQVSGTQLNLLGSSIRPANLFGNGRLQTGFGGRPNQVQVPIVYALDQGLDCAALFVDEALPLSWSFTGHPWTVSTAGPLGPARSFRFMVITGPDLPALRGRFLEITGRPLVPPQQAFGVWATGVAGSTETDWRDKVGVLKNSVPGLTGLLAQTESSLEPLLAAAKAYNLRLMVDESAYVFQDSDFYPHMARRSFLVRQGGPNNPIMVVNHMNRRGALVDYTNPAVPTYWHSLFREDQISAGITAFRLVDSDLPEASVDAWYEGPPNGQIHSHYAWANSYAQKWAAGIMAGASNQRMRVRPRLMMLSRSGLAGLQRLAGSLYNGEGSLFQGGSHLAARSHLALSGQDFYSSDISHNLASRKVEDQAQLYDAWLAKNALTDIPLVLPEDILLRPSARYNLGLRENLRPYYYSLAWEAYLKGQPLLAPLAYYFQADLAARDRVGELMLGSGLLLSLNFDMSAERVDVFVPKGRWYNWRTGEVIDQAESGLVSLDLKDAGQLTPPLLARAGAIIPGQEEMSLKGGGSEKIDALKIFIGQESSEFVWYEDDGESLGYVVGNFGKTVISAVTKADGSTVVTIKAREGSWDGAPAERRLLVDIYGPKAPGEATLDNQPHNRVARLVELDQLDSGWASIGTNRIRFKTPPLDMNVDHILWFK